MIQHAKDELPNEGCGILAGKDGKVLKVYKMTNTDKSPSTFFMEPQEQFEAMKDMRRLGMEMMGIYHSHVASPAYPSPRDVKLAFYPDVCYVIISLNDKENPQVRTFRIQEENISEEEIKFVCLRLFIFHFNFRHFLA
ncbi:M67 family metallopeptidase [Candidatus Poribacteria bacterium]|nr:M67 family metallopeptidase [Candidatus Poribacteria bacterium]